MPRELFAILLAGLAVASCGMNDAADFERGEKAEQAGNHAEAYWYWRNLAERGHAGAEYRIGWMYANGNGLVLDEIMAVQWWRRAAEQGHPDAAFALARAYRRGDGVSRDPAVAVHWLTRALQLGVEDAGPVLLVMAGIGVDRAETLVRDLLKSTNWRAWGGVYRVKADTANVRAGAGTEHALVGQLEQGSELLALHFEDGWVRIGLPGSGEFAWIYQPLIEAVP